MREYEKMIERYIYPSKRSRATREREIRQKSLRHDLTSPDPEKNRFTHISDLGPGGVLDPPREK